MRGWAHVWVRFHRWCARYICSASAPGSKARRPPAPALVAVKHQSMYETLEIILLLDEPAIGAEARAADIPLWGWVVAALRRHPGRPRRAARRRCARMMRAGRGGDRRGAADRDLPRRHAGRARRAAAAAAGLRRPLPGAEAAGRAGRARQRPALAAAQLRQAARDSSPSASARRSRPACRAPRSRPRSTRAINALEPADDARARPDRGLFRPALVLGRPRRRGPLPRAARLSLLSLRAQGRRLSAPPLAGAASARPSWPSSPRSARSAARRACASASASARSSSISIPIAAGRTRSPPSSPSSRCSSPTISPSCSTTCAATCPISPSARPRSSISPPSAAAPRRILCCPCYYSDDPILDVAFGERPPFYLEQLGRLLDPAIAAYLDRRGGLRAANSARPSRPRRRAAAPQAVPVGQLSGQ